ncbi:hypothetical protein VTH06DRAFT_3117 [Thermothelomyces fergusii]
MNTTFNSALKQRTTIRKELSALSGAATDGQQGQQQQQQPPPQLTPAALGSLSASVTAFARTVDEYGALAKQELDPAKQAKALERIRDFRADLADFRAQLAALKAARDAAAHAENTRELLGRRPYAAATPENPYAASTATASGYGLATTTTATTTTGRGHARTTSLAEAGGVFALREQQFFASTHSALDEYLARGQAVLGDLAQQREVLKSTQRRLYSAGNTLGISGDTIRMIERRAREDRWIFAAGVVVFFGFCWLVLRYLR